MIQKDKTYFSQTLEGIQIFEDDIDEIMSRLAKHSLNIEIHDENNLYENITEVRKINGIHPKTLKIDARNKTLYESASLDFDKKKVRISCHGTENMYALGFELKDYLKDRRPLYIRIFNSWKWFFFVFGSSGILKFALDSKDSVSRPWILWTWGAFAVILLVSVFTGTITHGLNLTRRHEYGFWKRNRDSIILAIIGTIFGILSTLLIQWLTKK